MNSFSKHGKQVRTIQPNGILLLIIVLSIIGCKGDLDPTIFNHGFTGITETSLDPTPIGTIDNDDWKADKFWNYPIVPCSQIAMPLKTSLRHVSDWELPDRYAVMPPYPNPAFSVTTLDIVLADRASVYTAIIDQNYKTVAVVYCNEEFQSGVYRIKINLSDLPLGIYRVIFQIREIETNYIVLQSHGDIWLKR